MPAQRKSSGRRPLGNMRQRGLLRAWSVQLMLGQTVAAMHQSRGLRDFAVAAIAYVLAAVTRCALQAKFQHCENGADSAAAVQLQRAFLHGWNAAGAAVPVYVSALPLALALRSVPAGQQLQVVQASACCVQAANMTVASMTPLSWAAACHLKHCSGSWIWYSKLQVQPHGV